MSRAESCCGLRTAWPVLQLYDTSARHACAADLAIDIAVKKRDDEHPIKFELMKPPASGHV